MMVSLWEVKELLDWEKEKENNWNYFSNTHHCITQGRERRNFCQLYAILKSHNIVICLTVYSSFFSSRCEFACNKRMGVWFIFLC